MVDQIMSECTQTFLLAVESVLVSVAVAGSWQVLWVVITMLRAACAT